MNSELMFMVSATTVSCLAVGVLGLLVLHMVRRRSVVLSLIVCALVPVAAVIVAVQVNVRAMFISDHDADVITVVSGTAGVMAVLIAVVLGRRLVAGSRMVGRRMRRLTEVYDDARTAGSAVRAGGHPNATPPLPVSAEIAQLTAELDDIRQRLEVSRNRERELESSRRELLASMSHDLRTPLAGLRALAEGLEDGMLADVPGAHAQLRTTAERMAAMVDDLFELSRLQALPAGRPKKLVSLRELVEDVAAEARPAAHARDVRLDVEVAGRLPVRGDGDELARALSNLIANAVRYTPTGGVVRVTGAESHGAVRVEVGDACGGIPAGDLDRVFDVGWRGEPQRTPVADSGAGLGLAIVRGVAESHAGSVSVRNAGPGCLFEVILPAATG